MSGLPLLAEALVALLPAPDPSFAASFSSALAANNSLLK